MSGSLYITYWQKKKKEPGICPWLFSCYELTQLGVIRNNPIVNIIPHKGVM